MGTAAVVKTLTSVGWNMHPGLYWLVFKIDSLGTTASVFNQINGPNPYMPQWTTSGGTTSPIAWKLTGQAAGALPVTFPTGATLATSAPAMAVLVNT